MTHEKAWEAHLINKEDNKDPHGVNRRDEACSDQRLKKVKGLFIVESAIFLSS